MDQVLYQKIQRVEDGVWVINNDDEIEIISIPLFLDFGTRKKNRRKQLITVFVIVTVIALAGFVAVSIYGTALDIFQGITSSK